MPVMTCADIGLAGRERTRNPYRPFNALFPRDLAASAEVLIDSLPDSRRGVLQSIELAIR
jgi:hypothetical protein